VETWYIKVIHRLKMTSTEKNSTINEVEKYETEVTKMCQNKVF